MPAAAAWWLASGGRAATQVGGAEVEDRAHGVVELTDAREAGGERDVTERQISGLDQHTRRLGSLRTCQCQRSGSHLGLQKAFELSGGVPELGCQPGDAVPVDGPVGDQPHGARDDVATNVPFRGPGGDVGPAALARAEAGALGRGGGGVEPDIAGERWADRTTGPAVDPGGEHRRDEPAVKPRVLGLDGAVTAVEVFVHAFHDYTPAPT